MSLQKYTIYIVALLLVACQSTYTLQSYNNEVIAVESKIDSTVLEIIKPYKNAIEFRMSEVLTYTKNDLKKEKLQSTIGNFVTDLCLEYSDAHMCIMNNGGLRTTISKGNITREKIYELMPFDNELVVVKLNKDDYIKLVNYIVSRGGEPFSGINIVVNRNLDIINYSWPVNFDKGEQVRLLTSDYLANGGDNMSFLKEKKQQKLGIKLRDAIINFCSKKDTIDIQLDDRIKILENE